MPHTSEHLAASPGSASEDCLNRTKAAVLNVLVAVGFMIALSGWLLRSRVAHAPAVPPRPLQQAMLLALFVTAAASYILRRVLSARIGVSLAAGRTAGFYWAHVIPAIIAALAAPLGLAYGFLIDPTLQGVIPFWVAALALGSLALPRRYECDDDAAHRGSRPGGSSERA
jgi:hypothetical protein